MTRWAKKWPSLLEETWLRTRFVIFKEEQVGGRATMTTDKARVLRDGWTKIKLLSHVGWAHRNKWVQSLDRNCYDYDYGDCYYALCKSSTLCSRRSIHHSQRKIQRLQIKLRQFIDRCISAVHCTPARYRPNVSLSGLSGRRSCPPNKPAIT